MAVLLQPVRTRPKICELQHFCGKNIPLFESKCWLINADIKEYSQQCRLAEKFETSRSTNLGVQDGRFGTHSPHSWLAKPSLEALPRIRVQPTLL